MVVGASGLLAWTLLRDRRQLAAMVAIGVLMPLTSLQMLTGGTALFLLLLAWRVPRAFRIGVAVAAGCVLGLAVLYLYSSTHGVWQAYLHNAYAHSQINAPSQNLTAAGGGNYGSFADKMRAMLTHPGELFAADYSAVFLNLLSVLLILGLRTQGRCSWRSPVTFGLAAAALVPPFLATISFFHVGYSWFVFVPLTIGTLWGLEEALAPGRSWALVATAGVLLAGAVLVGLPSRLLVTGFQWRQRDYGRVEQFVAAHVQAEDWVFADYPAFYALKPRVQADFYRLYPFRPEEKRQIGVMIFDPAEAAHWMDSMGGRWKLVAEMASSGKDLTILGYRRALAKPYNLAVYRRVQSDAPPAPPAR
jgi:hypothetical protein